LKKLFLLDPEMVYLNHGSFGATPREVIEVYQTWQRKLEWQPVQFLASDLNGLLLKAKELLAMYLKTTGNNLLFIPNTTFGVNMIARSLNLKPGDEILSTDHEYGACDLTWKFICQKTGAKYVPAHTPLSIEDEKQIIDAISGSLTSRTRMVFLSHISSPTSIIFPVEKIIRIAREAKIPTLIDGAHAPGQIELALDSLEADYYVGNCHKWLMAPKGSGFLYAKPEIHCTLEPLIVSWGWGDPNLEGEIQKFSWMGTNDPAAYLSVPAAIKFQDTHNWCAIRAFSHKLAFQAMEDICQFTELLPIYSDNHFFAQMVTIPLPPIQEPLLLKKLLLDCYKIEIPVIEWNERHYLRLSVQGYNSPADIDILEKVLKNLL
jgi:isopenicillin-N epimerase